MTDKITKKYTVEISIDPKKAREIKNGVQDFDAYRNWDINYLGEEEQFIKVMMDELKDHNKYSGISVKVKELKGEKANA